MIADVCLRIRRYIEHWRPFSSLALAVFDAGDLQPAQCDGLPLHAAMQLRLDVTVVKALLRAYSAAAGVYSCDPSPAR